MIRVLFELVIVPLGKLFFEEAAIFVIHIYYLYQLLISSLFNCFNLLVMDLDIKVYFHKNAIVTIVLECLEKLLLNVPISSK
jgi:hypothetical protein